MLDDYITEVGLIMLQSLDALDLTYLKAVYMESMMYQMKLVDRLMKKSGESLKKLGVCCS